MKIPVSPRLLACCRYVHNGDRVADVGCDHGYLGIYLLTSGIARSVIASDINEGPLRSAVINAAKYGVKDKIRFFLSDGLRNVPREFDTLVCAGMGADVMVSILEAAPWLRSEQYRLILQCQSKAPTLRRYLSGHGWHIRREDVLRDGRFLYTVMEIVYEPGHVLTPGEAYISPALRESDCPERDEYIRWVTDHLRITITGQGENAPTELREALAEIEAIL